MKQRKLHLATDFYQFSVSNVYHEVGLGDRTAVFDLFFRKNPFDGGYAIFAGLEQVIEYIQNMKFEEEDLRMLKENHPELTDGYIDFLRNFKFSGEIYAMPEGTVVFPQEPLIRVKAPLAEAQLIETTMLAIVNHQTLIATKASRVCDAAMGDSVLDFGLRRAHGTEAGLYGTRACIIGGCSGTADTEAEYYFDIVSKGTMSHAFVMSFEDEYDAFEAFAKYNPNNVIVLVDSYDTLKSGVPNACKLFTKLKAEGGCKGSYGIRLDSGDLSYLSKEARKMLDAAGHEGAVISASSDLDEYRILDLKNDGAQIGMWGVGTKMITAYDCPALGAVYKLSALEDENGNLIPRMKISDTPEKITNPGYKKVVRLYDRATGRANADLITFADETVDDTKDLKIYHPNYTYKNRVVTDFYAKDLLVPVFVDGELVYNSPKLEDIRAYCKKEKKTFWSGNLRFMNPNEFHVDISDKLYDYKKELFNRHKG
ncbi:MAG: nicotinate phosphoribosyltransferase [Anaerofustis stercorihominis]|nr:nicotinate phosphoribosyltransferase [Anaerofustis stercorihominis]